MSDWAIKTEDLGKRYILGNGVRHNTLRDQLAEAAKQLFTNKPAPVNHASRVSIAQTRAQPTHSSGSLSKSRSKNETAIESPSLFFRQVGDADFAQSANGRSL